MAIALAGGHCHTLNTNAGRATVIIKETMENKDKTEVVMATGQANAEIMEGGVSNFDSRT